MTDVLYIGSKTGTSLKRYIALQNFVENHSIIDPKDALSFPFITSRWSYKTGALFLEKIVNNFIVQKYPNNWKPDLVIVDNGEMIGSSIISKLKSLGSRVVNFNLDNPFSERDGYRFRLLRNSIDQYDVIFTPRKSSVESAIDLGSKKAIQIWQAADDGLTDVSNHPSQNEKASYLATVSFTGTWMNGRDDFIVELMNRGIDVKINGSRWEKSPRFNKIKDNIRSGYLDQNGFYAAIAASDISIGLLSDGNLDQHTTRSMEIPSLRSLLVAKRTHDHMLLYNDKSEAFFWDDAEECAQIIKYLTLNPENLLLHRELGYKRALKNNNFNTPLMRYVVEKSLE